MNNVTQNVGVNGSSEGEGVISIVEIWRIIVSEKKLVLSAAILLALVSLIASFFISPLYRAEVLLAPASDDGNKDRLGGLGGLASQYGGLASMAGINLGQSGTKAIAVATLQSRVLTESYIREENLLPILFPRKWNAVNGKWNSEDIQDIPTLWDGNKLFEKKIRQVSQNKLTGLITITIDWTDPKLAAEWANDLVKRTNLYMQQREIEQSNRNIAYLEQQLKTTSIVEIQQAISVLLASEIKSVMLAQGNAEFAFQVIDPAVIPQEKYFPKRSVFTAFGFIMGLLLSSVFVCIRRTSRSFNS